VQGEGYTKMSKRIKDTLDGNATKAITVVRTEAHRVQNDGRLQSMQHAEKKGLQLQKMWVASLDDRTRKSHAKLDGQVVDIDKPFVVDGHKAMAPNKFGRPELDINCRCKIVERVVGFDYSQVEEKRTSWDYHARESKTIPYDTYDSWVENRLYNSK
jgi:SPP1 gp7 family putative phage head morphogenesis protein